MTFQFDKRNTAIYIRLDGEKISTKPAYPMLLAPAKRTNFRKNYCMGVNLSEQGSANYIHRTNPTYCLFQ